MPLAHHERLLRRRRLVTVHDEGFLVDLPRTTAVAQGDAFELEDGRLIDVVAAEEPLIEVAAGTSPASPGTWATATRPARSSRTASWSRATRCCARCWGLGATVARRERAVPPEGGAYGEGTRWATRTGRATRARGLAHDPLSGGLQPATCGRRR